MRIKLLFVILALSLGAMAQTQHGVTLNWNSETGVSGYNVYAGTTSGGPYTKNNSAMVSTAAYTVPLTNTNSGIKTFFVVTAVGTDGVESGWSNEVSATFLLLTPAPTGLSATSQ